MIVGPFAKDKKMKLNPLSLSEKFHLKRYGALSLLLLLIYVALFGHTLHAFGGILISYVAVIINQLMLALGLVFFLSFFSHDPEQRKKRKLFYFFIFALFKTFLLGLGIYLGAKFVEQGILLMLSLYMLHLGIFIISLKGITKVVV